MVLILLALGGAVWAVQQSLAPQPRPAVVEEAAEPGSETSTARRALDYSKANGDAANNAMSDQLKAVQQMTGGRYDGQTYVLPGAKK